MSKSQMPNCSQKLYNIMVKCWKYDRSERPTFAELNEMLSNFWLEPDSYFEVRNIMLMSALLV